MPETDRPTILLVEDDDVDAYLITRLFAKADLDHPIVRARNGLEALDILRQRHEGDEVASSLLVLLDLNMPQMDGHEFLAAVRGDDVLRQTIVFVLTTSTDEVDIRRAYERNVAGYLEKDRGDGRSPVIQLVDDYSAAVRFP